MDTCRDGMTHARGFDNNCGKQTEKTIEISRMLRQREVKKKYKQTWTSNLKRDTKTAMIIHLECLAKRHNE